MHSNGRIKKSWFHPRLLTDDVLVGLLLSDGSLLKQKNNFQNSMFQLTQSIKNKGMIDYIEKYLNEIGISTYKKTHVRKLGTVINLNTERHPLFTELRRIWYPNDKKIVPDSVKLTSKSVAYWFMGDGNTTWYKRGNKKVHISIATDGFDTNSVISLQGNLHDIGIDMHLRFRIGNTRPYIETKKAEFVYKFMTIIKPHILPCFYYKIKIPSLNTKTGCVPLWKRDRTRHNCSVNSCPRTSMIGRTVCNIHKSRETKKANLINQ